MIPQPLSHALLVALGGAVGSLTRWAVAVALQRLGHFPWWTLAVNVVGCLLGGVLMGRFGVDRSRFTDEVRLLVMVGFLGGLTTFSTFSTDTLILVRRAPGLAAINVALNVCLSLGAVVLGARLGAALART